MRARTGTLLPPVAIVVAVMAGGSAIPASGGPASPKAADERIAVKDNFFSPLSVNLERGDRVKWVWRGDNRHNVTFTRVPKGASRRGARTKRNGRWYRTFRKRGRYSYVCTLFAGMRGWLSVED